MTVELFRIPTPASMDVFDLGWPTWEALLDLGRSFGWVPQGTILIEPDQEEALEAQDADSRARLESLLAIPEPSYEVQVNLALVRGGIENRLNPYAPVFWGFLGMRRVTPEDAAAFAEALDRALAHMQDLKVDLPHKGPFLLAEVMDEQLFQRTNGGVSRKLLEDFIPFLRRGGFGISEWD